MTDKATLEKWVKERDSRIERLTRANTLLSRGLVHIVQKGAIGSYSVQKAQEILLKAGYDLPKRDEDA